jgi:xylulokinase
VGNHPANSPALKTGNMLLLGIDVGTSSIKASVVDGATQRTLASAQYPETEAEIISLQTGWAEQSPDKWWEDVKKAIRLLNYKDGFTPSEIGAIGISYQMHGLVLVDKEGAVLRHSIIWCDSRAVPYGERAFRQIGEDNCLCSLLNSPGNFTAAKLAWVKEHEPDVFKRIHKVMLPGDFIALRLTGQVTTTPSALSEGVFWDFKRSTVSKEVLSVFGYDRTIIPDLQEVFSEHGSLLPEVAAELGLKPGIPLAYKAGDQPNNALSLNVLEPGEVAATAGTSGVIYGVSDQLTYDPYSRVNSFAHVNHTEGQTRVGVLLCINGTGILNKWIRNVAGGTLSYKQMDEQAAGIAPGSDGLSILPFGNGAERILNNRILQAQVRGIDLNKHTPAHLFRAAQEGIAFAFRYGLDIMRENGMNPQVIRAGRANMFLSPVFTDAFVQATGVPVELHECDGSVGAALGAGIGADYFQKASDAFVHQSMLKIVEPTKAELYNEFYAHWKSQLERELKAL